VASAKPLKWVLGARSETGYVRTANEDRMGWTRTAHGNAYVVSDGMGGHRGGALAAELTVRTLRDQLAALSANDTSFNEQVRQAFVAANNAVYRERRPDNPETRDMGATAVALITEGERILVGHVGDSRAYLWRKRGGLQRLTRDHTRVRKMLDAGIITPEQAAVHPDASVLDRAIGHLATVEVDVSAWMALRPGDMVLLCSDGLCGYVDDSEIDAILRTRGDPQNLVDRLVDCALLKGGEDNVTVQLVMFGGPSSGLLADLWARPPALLALGAVVSAVVAWIVATEAVAPIGQRIDALQSRLEGIGHGPAPASAPGMPSQPASHAGPQPTPLSTPQPPSQPAQQPTPAQSSAPTVTGAGTTVIVPAAPGAAPAHAPDSGPVLPPPQQAAAKPRQHTPTAAAHPPRKTAPGKSPRPAPAAGPEVATDPSAAPSPAGATGEGEHP
jgi:serine/threonine protein phosphatase PrpC